MTLLAVIGGITLAVLAVVAILFAVLSTLKPGDVP